jgi:hypothetical protein
MLENSLKIREKYVNKLKAKIDSITESLDLLHKVDMKLVGGGLQRGGLDNINFEDLEKSLGFYVSNIDPREFNKMDKWFDLVFINATNFEEQYCRFEEQYCIKSNLYCNFLYF